MRSSGSVTNTEKQQPPYGRKRDHPHFHGVRRSESNLSTRSNKLASPRPSFSRSLSDIWELESKHSVPDTTDSETVMPERLTEKIGQEEEAPEEEELSTQNRNLPIISLPQTAASYYYDKDWQNTNFSSIAACKSIEKLNCYLKARKDDIKAGIPGKYLHAVISQEVNDVVCFVCPIMYAFFLSETQKNDQLCTVPVINMKREDLSLHTELKWLVASCQIDEANLVFVDEVDLAYHDQYGNLKIVLLNGHKLSDKQEGLKEAVVEIFYGKEGGSCCTLIAEKFAEKSPEILYGQGFSRLLLSGILLDTENLTNDTCTSKDKYMATLLIKGAGRFGSNGLYQILRYKMHDISSLKVKEILRKEYKKWTRVAGKPNKSRSRLSVSHIGLSSIGISIEELLAHEDSATDEIILFQVSEKLRLLMIVSGYYDKQKKFKREILVSTYTAVLMKKFLNFLDANGTHLPLKAIDQLGLRSEFKAFEVENKLTSRRSIERLLEEFSGVLRQN